MKKFITIVVIGVLLLSTGNAQKGSVLVAGSLALSSNNDNNSLNKTSNFAFNPTIGYQLNDSWTTGLVASIGSYKSETGTTTNLKSNQFVVGPFIRYTKSLSTTFSVYGQLQGLFGSSKRTFPTSESKTSLTSIQLIPAVFINLKNNFGLNFGFGGINYSSSTLDAPGAKSMTGFSIDFGSSFNFGISKNF